MKARKLHTIMQALAIGACLGFAPPSAHAQAQATTEQIDENIAYAIGVQAVYYGFGPVVMHQGILAQTDADSPSDNGQAPINQMGHARNLYGPDDKLVVTANNDTLYSIAALDLSREPMVLTIPDTNGRYYIMQLLDAYSRSIDDIGIGTLGAKGGTFAIVGPHWTGELPPEMVMIRSPTPEVSIIGRTGVDNPEDLAKAHAVQDAYRLVPLSEYASPGLQEDRPRPQGREARRFCFPRASASMGCSTRRCGKTRCRKTHPSPTSSSASASALNTPSTPRNCPRRRSVGWDARCRTASRRSSAPPRTRARGSTAGTWSSRAASTATTSCCARQSIPSSSASTRRCARFTRIGYDDDHGRPLNGKNTYTLSFDGKVPVRAFWSLTMYDAKELYMVQNAIKRYSIGDRTKGLKTNPDGSVTIYIQAASPGADRESNWLPAPEGDFFLQMRLYEPMEQVLNGSYRLPQVVRTAD